MAGTPALHFVSDRRRLAPDARTDEDALSALEALIDEVLDAGVDVVQIRERDVDLRRLQALVARVAHRAAAAGARVVVNDRVDVAAAAGAQGVHLPGDAPPAARVRTIDARWFIGASVHAGDDVASRAAGADYVVFGSVFPTASKRPGSPVAGLDALAAAVGAAGRVPVIAIGGVTPATAREVVAAGAGGVAAIGAFLSGGAAAVRAFHEAFDGVGDRVIC